MPEERLILKWFLTLRSIRSILVLTLLSTLWGSATAQNCIHSIEGRMADMESGRPIMFATVMLDVSKKGAITDTAGVFQISGVCSGKYDLLVRHIGYDPLDLVVELNGDTTLTILLKQNNHMLSEASVFALRGGRSIRKESTVTEDQIFQNASSDLSRTMEGIPGVGVIKNGSGIAKPVIHGLTGNRLTQVQNGVVQSGQNWGQDHGIEVDPLIAGQVSILKGAAALEFMGQSFGAVMLVQPAPISSSKGLKGHVGSYFESNGLAAGIHFSLQEKHESFGWRTILSVRKSGDKRAPGYYLNNTGGQQVNGALQLMKIWSDRLKSEVYLSSYAAELGVLRGSQIGNVTDLVAAFSQDIPFFTEPNFSYDIGPPRQVVKHQFLKFKTTYFVGENNRFDLTLASQINLRKEFDVRRSGRSDKPALSLSLNSQFAEGKYTFDGANGWEVKTGLQMRRSNNANIPETGILPLIPNYLSYEFGAFATAVKSFKHFTMELGGRYEFEDRNAAAISNTVPREVVRYLKTYQNLAGLFGITFPLSQNLILTGNLGYASRRPQVNELYSNGLHQGVSGIEEGDIHLKEEQSVKGLLTVDGKIGSKITMSITGYYQLFDDYIYLAPQDELRLTIRGAFPVFKYEQDNASIMGVDVETALRISSNMKFAAVISLLKGTNRTANVPLVNMPSNSLFSTLDLKVPSAERVENLMFQVNFRYVAEQKNLLAWQDFIAPPPSYALLGFKISADKTFKASILSIFLRADNLLNTTYRDYLNRQRYFADEPGINITLGTKLTF